MAHDLDRLASLSQLQTLLELEAQADLSLRTERLAQAERQTQMERSRLISADQNLAALFAANSFDPDAVARAGSSVLATEADLLSSQEAEEAAQIAEVQARSTWKVQMHRSEHLAEKWKKLEKKARSKLEDKALRDLVSLTAYGRNR